MRKLLLTLFFILFAFPVVAERSATGYPLELLMAHNPACSICIRFMNEVEADYHNSEQAKTLPLVIISVYDQPEWFKQAYAENRIKPIRGTPTFIIWNGRKELSRLVGYSTKKEFYKRINIFIEAIDKYENQ